MPMSLTLASLWAASACIMGMTPGRYHWPAARVLIATGIPILGYVTVQAGPWWGLALLAAACSVLRWPVFYAARWVRRIFLQ